MFSIEDRIYIAKYYGKVRTLQIAWGLNNYTKISDVEREIERQKAEGVYELYKSMSEEEYERICIEEKMKEKRKKWSRGH